MKLIATKGLPASGKSTWAREKEKTGSWVRISMDDVRKFIMPNGKFSIKKELIARKLQKDIAISLKESKYNIIFDDTNLNPRTLENAKKFAEENDFKFEVKDFSENINRDDINEYIKRDELRKEKVGYYVILKMSLQYFSEIYKNDKFIICDIDGTVANLDHRLKFIEKKDNEKANWVKFFENMDKDKPIVLTFKLLEEYSEKGYEVVFVTARPEEYREKTEKWISKSLEKYPRIKKTGIIMRESGDNRDDAVVKSEIYNKYLKNLNIEVVVDDRPKVIRMWEEKGLKVIKIGNREEF